MFMGCGKVDKRFTLYLNGSITILIFVLSLFLFNSCDGSNSLSKKRVREVTNLNDFPEHLKVRDCISFPFAEQLDQILVVSYRFTRLAGEKADTVDYTSKIVVDDQIGFNEFYEQKVLDSLEEKELENLLMCCQGDNDNSVADCYMPRNCIYFLDEDKKVLDYIEICFSCGNTIRKENSQIPVSCVNDLQAIEAFLMKVGIRHGLTDRSFDFPERFEQKPEKRFK
jgi:hypothetical protein